MKLGPLTGATDKSPPWVLFIDKGRPVAIPPAMRPGEVANVEHLTMRQAREIVRLANTLHAKLVEARLEKLSADLQSIHELLSTKHQHGRETKE